MDFVSKVSHGGKLLTDPLAAVVPPFEIQIMRCGK
jgi:hypothetical protein